MMPPKSQGGHIFIPINKYISLMMKDQVGSCSIRFLGMKPTVKNALSITQISQFISLSESRKPDRRQHKRKLKERETTGSVSLSNASGKVS